jgi:TolA-binding protein
MSGDIIDFKSLKKAKDTKEHASPKMPADAVKLDQSSSLHNSPHLKGKHLDDFRQRISRMRSSIERINHLMQDLKKISESKSQLSTRSNVSYISEHHSRRTDA